MGLKSWFKNLFSKIGSLIKRGWSLAKPFLQEFLSKSANSALDSLQDIAMSAVKQISAQGLPTDEAKQKAFADYMKNAAVTKGIEIKDFEINLLRETAYSIWKKSQER